MPEWVTRRSVLAYLLVEFGIVDLVSCDNSRGGLGRNAAAWWASGGRDMGVDVSKLDPREDDIDTGDNGVVRASSNADVNGVEGPARGCSDERWWSVMIGLPSSFSISLARPFPLSCETVDGDNPLRSAILPHDP